MFLSRWLEVRALEREAVTDEWQERRFEAWLHGQESFDAFASMFPEPYPDPIVEGQSGSEAARDRSTWARVKRLRQRRGRG